MSFLLCDHLMPSRVNILESSDMEKYFNNEVCTEVVKKKLKCDNFDFIGYELDDCSMVGFNGKRRKLRVKVKEPGKSEWTLIHFYTKELLGSAAQVGVRSNLFYKEAEIYNKLLPDFAKYIKGKVFPDCYLAKPNELIILEDLDWLGYQGRENCSLYDEEHIEKLLEAVAKLHAASIIYEKQNNIKLDQLMPNLLEEVVYVQDINNHLFEFLCASISAIESVAEIYFSHMPKELCERANKLMLSIPERLKMINENSKCKVFSHADLWNKNIMFRYNREKKVESAILHDFQLSKYTTPTFDILQAIYLTTSNTVRETQLESLLIHYFNHLSRELAENDIAINNILTWPQFKEGIDELLPTMLAITPVCLHFMLLPKEVVQPALISEDAREKLIREDRSEIVLKAMRENEKYHKRISHAVLDLLEYLKLH